MERTIDHPGLCLSPVFLVPKCSGKFRMILNLKRINLHISPAHFRMETLGSILPLLMPGDWTASIDLKGCLSPRPYRACIKGPVRLYSGRKHVPGLRPAPRLFTRLVACMAAFLRQRGLRLFCYLDDWLLAAKSQDLLSRQLHFLLQTVQALGFLVNWEKSELALTRRPTFLGAAIDLPRQLARPCPDRVNTIMASASRLAGPSQGLAPIPGVTGQPSRFAPGLPAAHASPADTSAQALQPLQGLTHATS